jgi:hypothetical protein
MGDLTIQCVQCGRSFTWSTGEQEFFRTLNYPPPKHCKVCLSQRHAEHDPGNRGLSGPPTTWMAPDSATDASLGQEHPVTPRPLWRGLRHSHEMRLISQFVHLDPAMAPTLDGETFSLLAQWMFEQFGRETVSAEAQLAGVDLYLRCAAEQREEFARIYHGGTEGPPDSIYDLLDRLAGKQVDQIYLYTFAAFTPHQREVGRQLPLAIDLLEGQALRARLQEAQQRFHAQLGHTRPASATAVVPHGEVLGTGEKTGPTRPYYSRKAPS